MCARVLLYARHWHRAEKVYSDLLSATSEIMKQAPSAVFTSLAGFREDFEAKDATDMNRHIREAMNRHGTVSSISTPDYFQLGHLLISKKCRIRAITSAISQSQECQEKVEAMVMSLDAHTVSVVWENMAVWGRLWGALMKLTGEEMVVYKSRLRNHLSTLCSRLTGDERKRADTFFDMAKEDNAACEEVTSSPSSSPSAQRAAVHFFSFFFFFFFLLRVVWVSTTGRLYFPILFFPSYICTESNGTYLFWSRNRKSLESSMRNCA